MVEVIYDKLAQWKEKVGKSLLARRSWKRQYFYWAWKMVYDFKVTEKLWNDLKICDRDLELG